MAIRAINLVTLLIVILGGINWGLVGLFDLDVVTVIYQRPPDETESSDLMIRVIYGLIGASALWQFGVWARRLLAPESRG